MATIRLTAAQALVRYLAAQRGELNGAEVALFAGVWAIFGHGNVATLGGLCMRRARYCRLSERTMNRRWALLRSASQRRLGGGG
jgi:TPP-dependent trihydroxycyclohexane-1,2-dione (THcHDO) dehydratase